MAQCGSSSGVILLPVVTEAPNNFGKHSCFLFPSTACHYQLLRCALERSFRGLAAPEKLHSVAQEQVDESQPPRATFCQVALVNPWPYFAIDGSRKPRVANHVGPAPSRNASGPLNPLCGAWRTSSNKPSGTARSTIADRASPPQRVHEIALALCFSMPLKPSGLTELPGTPVGATCLFAAQSIVGSLSSQVLVGEDTDSPD